MLDGHCCISLPGETPGSLHILRFTLAVYFYPCATPPVPVPSPDQKGGGLRQCRSQARIKKEEGLQPDVGYMPPLVASEFVPFATRDALWGWMGWIHFDIVCFQGAGLMYKTMHYALCFQSGFFLFSLSCFFEICVFLDKSISWFIS